MQLFKCEGGTVIQLPVLSTYLASLTSTFSGHMIIPWDASGEVPLNKSFKLPILRTWFKKWTNKETDECERGLNCFLSALCMAVLHNLLGDKCR